MSENQTLAIGPWLERLWDQGGSHLLLSLFSIPYDVGYSRISSTSNLLSPSPTALDLRQYLHPEVDEKDLK